MDMVVTAETYQTGSSVGTRHIRLTVLDRAQRNSTVTPGKLPNHRGRWRYCAKARAGDMIHNIPELIE